MSTSLNIRTLYQGLAAYAVPKASARPPRLKLDANESPTPTGTLATLAGLTPQDLSFYAAPVALEQTLARRWNVDPAQVLVTAGGDEAIDRLCRVMLQPGRSLLFPTPSFEMIPRSARTAGANVCEVPWSRGNFPAERVAQAIDPTTALVAVVSPNNPTGQVCTPAGLRLVAARAAEVGAAVLLDAAYAEFADEDLTPQALNSATANIVTVRTFSKAWGLAGTRIGYAIGPAPLISAMRAAGGPYPVSTLSLAIATFALETGEGIMRSIVSLARSERDVIITHTRELGFDPWTSQANFVLIDCQSLSRAAALWHALADQGIAVRAFPSSPDPLLARSLRFTCPCSKPGLITLINALTFAAASLPAIA